MKDLSVIIPIYNEEDNINLLYDELKKVLVSLTESHEIIFIDDGSRDSTFKKLDKLKQKDRTIKIIRFSENKGNSAAMDKGFKSAKGKIIISMDADLQNDPKDIPKLLNKLNQGYDVVCGWRYNRKDSMILKKIPSKFANFILRKTTGLKIHDTSCALRVYKNSVVKNLNLFKGAHRLIPVMLAKKGFNMTELKVNHRPRIYCKAKYNSPLRGIEFIIGLYKILFRKY